MSHNKDEVIVCPNCGYEAKYNYCEQCGQPTHLHKETFLGLIVHFVAHYFHYDSKFFQTIKTLMLKPGALTLAYWNNQRMRFIPPISLYIFVSTVFFIISFFFLHSGMKVVKQGTVKQSLDSLVIANKSIDTAANVVVDTVNNITTTTVRAADVPDITTHIFNAIEKALHETPKILFFMVPFLALMLKIVFVRRKELFYVDHAVFSLHIHTCWFILLLVYGLLRALVPDSASFIKYALFGAGLIGSVYYLVAAVKKTYGLSAGRALFLGLSALALDMMVFFALLILLVIYYLWELIMALDNAA